MGQLFNSLVEAAGQKFWEASDEPFLDDQGRFEHYSTIDAATDALKNVRGISLLSLIDELMKDDSFRLGEAAQNIDYRDSFGQAVDTLIAWMVATKLEEDSEVVAKAQYRLNRAEFEAEQAAASKS